jgi:hypothetical protein
MSTLSPEADLLPKIAASALPDWRDLTVHLTE